MKIKAVLSLMFCFLIISCMTYMPPVQQQIQKSFDIDQPFDRVWQSVIEIFAKLNLSIMNMERASGLITTDWISFGYRDSLQGYCSCGFMKSGGGKDKVPGDRRGRFNVYVKKTSESACQLQVNAVFEAVTDTIGRIYCESTGKLEMEIYKGVLNLLGWK